MSVESKIDIYLDKFHLSLRKLKLMYDDDE